MLAQRLPDLLFDLSLAKVALPAGVGVLDPFHGDHSSEGRRIVREFHQRYYADDHERLLMLGINPGRLGAGSTGLCFTDTKRCESELGIAVKGFRTHEPSSDFFYRMITAAGGPDLFYSKVLVQAVCPLGFTKPGPKGAPVNLNYYDDPALQSAVTPFILDWLRGLITTGVRTDVIFCIGTGKNLAYLQRLNAEHHLFVRIVALEHPRFIMQYRAKQLDDFVAKYLHALDEAARPYFALDRPRPA